MPTRETLHVLRALYERSIYLVSQIQQRSNAVVNFVKVAGNLNIIVHYYYVICRVYLCIIAYVMLSCPWFVLYKTHHYIVD